MDVQYVQTRRLSDDLRVLGETIRLFTLALARKFAACVSRPRPDAEPTPLSLELVGPDKGAACERETELPARASS